MEMKKKNEPFGTGALKMQFIAKLNFLVIIANCKFHIFVGGPFSMNMAIYVICL